MLPSLYFFFKKTMRRIFIVQFYTRRALIFTLFDKLALMNHIETILIKRCNALCKLFLQVLQHLMEQSRHFINSVCEKGAKWRSVVLLCIDTEADILMSVMRVPQTEKFTNSLYFHSFAIFL